MKLSMRDYSATASGAAAAAGLAAFLAAGFLAATFLAALGALLRLILLRPAPALTSAFLRAL